MLLLTYVKNRPLGVKLSLITGLMCIPIVSLLYAFLSTRQETITLTRQELMGVAYLKPATQLLDRMIPYRDLLAVHLTVPLDQKDRLLLFNFQADINDALKTLGTTDQHLGSALSTTGLMSRFTQRWQDVQQPRTALTPKESLEQHAELIQILLGLMQQVGDRSGLILDPALDTYYLMDTALNKLPVIKQQLSTLRSVGGAIAARKQRTGEEHTRLLLALGQLQSSLEALQRSLHVAMQEQSALAQPLAPLLTRATEKTEMLLKVAQQHLIQPDTLSTAPLDFFAVGTEALTPLAQLHQETLIHLQTLLEQRLHRLTTSRTIQLALALCLTALAVLVVWSMHQMITQQLARIRTLFSHIEAGNYSARAEVLSRDDLGTMAASLNAMLASSLSLIQSQEERDAIQMSIMKLLDEVSGVAEGNLAVEAEVTTDMTGAIADAFNYMIYQLRSLVAQVQEATLHVSTSAHAVQTTADHLATGSTMQATQIVDSSAALNDIVRSIQGVSDNATLSATVAAQALTNAKQGTMAVQNTISGMQRIRTQVQETARRIKRLGERSQEISEIVQLIGDIADRTSIVAFNASIQAVRAGDSGRAFVVVAEEVERLAERAATATRQIADLVSTIQSETHEAVTAMEESTREVVQGSMLADQAGQALHEIETVSTRLAHLIHSISLATQQQVRGSENLSKTMGDISAITQQTAAGVQQAAVSIDHLAMMAEALRGAVSAFRLPTSTNGHS